MKIWSMGQISPEEKSDILSKHGELYDGYKVIQNTKNTQPLYVQDFAKDKGGITVSNSGDVKPYTNTNINETKGEDICEQCGGTMNESICEQCGWDKNTIVEEYKKGKLDNIYNTSDIDKNSKFDYTESEVDEQDVSGARGVYGDMSPAYDFDSDGPGKGGPYQTFSTPTGYSEDEDYHEEFKQLGENFISQNNKIIDMFKRMNVI